MHQVATPEAFRLFTEGQIALAQVERNGMRIDVDYLDRTSKEVKKQITDLKHELRGDVFYKHYRKQFGMKANLGSLEQLGKIVFEKLKYPSIGNTASGRYRTDEEAFESVDIPFVKKLRRLRKLEKVESTYLKNIIQETVDGYLHPIFNLNTVMTFRSCVAKGTMIEVVRDLSKHPKGIPIEKVKVGDLVYCYDDKLNLVIRPVVWAGKTGRRRVIRLHWSSGYGKKGYLDVTPEHKIRMASGEYVRADKLASGDYRIEGVSKHRPRRQTLAMGRNGDLVYPTNRAGIQDHRLVYRETIGRLHESEVVHHRDGNHFNNTPDNLEKMSLEDHARLHSTETLTDDVRHKGLAVRSRNHRIYGDRWDSGVSHYRYVKLSKYQLLRMLIHSGGRPSKTDYDFSVIRRYMDKYEISMKQIADRFDGDRRYITLGRLKQLHPMGRTVLMRGLKVNFYKLKRILEHRGLSTTRMWGNQFGRFIPHNHKITRVEWIDKTCDVYDLEVKGEHNFIANEICVHNSCQFPNAQNIPNRNEDFARYVRRAFIPRKGRRLIEIDFKGAEVCVSACYNKDPVLIEYIKNPKTDMHRDTAMRLFLLKEHEVDKKTTRDAAKNRFVFPEFYGSVYFQCAPNLWKGVLLDSWRVMGSDGAKELTVREHLASKGISELGDCSESRAPRKGTFEYLVKQVEDDFWNRRFKVYTRWKNKVWQEYQQRGEMITKTGFRIAGDMRRNQVLNAPIQGSAFHCLLWSLIRLQKWLNKRRMKTLIICQIHDSVILDADPKEELEVLAKLKQIITVDLPRVWNWIIVPLSVEAEASQIDGNWFEKKGIVI